MFEDDTKLYTSIRNEEPGQTLQQDIKKLEHWPHKWQVSFSASKYKVLHLGKHNIKYTYKMGLDTRLEETTMEEDMDIYVVMN